MKQRSQVRWAGLLVLVVLGSLQGCATTGHGPDFGKDPSGVSASDPLRRVNRKVFNFNIGLYHHVLRPITKGYEAVTPSFLRTGVADFFANAAYPYILLNDFLQWRLRQGLSDTARFLANSLLGAGGLFDVASGLGLPPHKNSFGVTLGVWGIPQGPYLVLPFLGPSSVRNLPEIPLEILTSPFYYVTNSTAQWSLGVAGVVNTGYVNRAAVRTVEESMSPYYFARNAWEQHEQYLIHGRNLSHNQLLDGLGPLPDRSAPATKIPQ